MAADARIQSLRATLEEERQTLRSQLSELGYGNKGLAYDPNFADSSQVTAERGENEALVNKLVEGLREVEHALEKLGTDRYGVCENCGQEIAEARLEARPEARLCIDCAAASRR
ncbi:MAG TPA: TraR/DksA C4-type zinc finger protein [Acidimicrobiales bacterium]|nr:TraR/DksA C4-type zinc finger protein [Acidimicrobiales bacterium]